MGDEQARKVIVREMSLVRNTLLGKDEEERKFVRALSSWIEHVHGRYQKQEPYATRTLATAVTRMYESYLQRGAVTDSVLPDLVHPSQAATLGAMLGLPIASVVTLLYHHCIEDDSRYKATIDSIINGLNQITLGLPWKLHYHVRTHLFMAAKRAWLTPHEQEDRIRKMITTSKDPSLYAEVTIDSLLTLLHADSKGRKEPNLGRRSHHPSEGMDYIVTLAQTADDHYHFSLNYRGGVLPLKLSDWVEDLAR